MAETGHGVPGQSIFLLCCLAVSGAFGSFVNVIYRPTLPQIRADFYAVPPVVSLDLYFGYPGK